jgi:plastocyanin
MSVSRTVAVMMLASGLAAGCTSSGGGNSSSSGASSGPTGSGASSGAGGQCSRASAETARQTVITKTGFAPSCVSIKKGARFYFINNERKHHTATTRAGAPTSFDADLAKKGSTYFAKFTKPGTYRIYDKVTGKAMTLFVAD